MKASIILVTALVSFLTGLAMGGIGRFGGDNGVLQLTTAVLPPVVLGYVFARYFWVVPFALTFDYAVFYWPGSGVSAVGSSMMITYSPVIIAFLFIEVLLGFGVAKMVARLRKKPTSNPDA